MKRKARLFSLFILMSVLLLFVYNCTNVESSTPKAANLSIQINDDGYGHYPAGKECVRKINWSIKPVTLTGDGGQSTTLDMRDQQYKSTVQEGDCHYSQSVQDLKAGKWIIEASASDSVYASWKTECSVTLNPGENTVYFDMGIQGCSRTKYWH